VEHLTRRAAIVLALVALGHLLRLVFQVEIVADGVRYPLGYRRRRQEGRP
jgi:hypothetical protein